MELARHMLEIKDLHAEIDGKPILKGVTLSVKPGEVAAIMGPNGSGKSTLSYVIAGKEDYEVTQGQVLLDGRSIHETPTRELARKVGLLPQSPIAPEGITVDELIRRGRHPHSSLFSRWTAADEEAVDNLLARRYAR